MIKPILFITISGTILFVWVTGCRPSDANVIAPGQVKEIDSRGEGPEMKRKMLSNALKNEGRLDDSTRLFNCRLTDSFYQKNGYGNVWSRFKNWVPLSDSLFFFIQQAKLYGLYPDDYHLGKLGSMRTRLSKDSLLRTDERIWSEADVLQTDACIHMINDIRYGRMGQSVQYDSNQSKRDFLVQHLTRIINNGMLHKSMAEIEPKIKPYHLLKEAIPGFIDSMDHRLFTYVLYPYNKKNSADSMKFMRSIQKRLMESGASLPKNRTCDSIELAEAVKFYQRLKQQKATGIIDASLVRHMNTTDASRFQSIAITLDRYREFNHPLPEKFVWVNLPAYRLELWDKDRLALESRIICGRPNTRTPVLESKITDMVIYPTWTVPTSIIVNQYLPRLKNNPHYLTRLGLRVYGLNGKPINPASVNWAKYQKGVPYLIRQNSGDHNALGVIKFNFNNEHSVYLHDTNQRYLFQNGYRALSHGCVRVEKWDSLAHYIARNDSLNIKAGDTLRYNSDSLRRWLSNKQHRKVDVNNPVPLFITYFSCEGKSGKLLFHDDIYGEDHLLRQKYFAD